MINKYVSRYSKYDTHFKNNDPWPLANFKEDQHKESLLLMVSASLGLILLLVVFAFI